MDTDNESSDVVAASPAGVGGIGDTEALEPLAEAARSRDAITRKIRKPTSENKRAATPPPTPRPLPISTPAPAARTPTPVAKEAVVSGPVASQAMPTEAAPAELPLTESATAELGLASSSSQVMDTIAEAVTDKLGPASSSSQAMEAAAEPTPVITPDLGRLMELSGNIHLFSAVPEPPDDATEFVPPATQPRHKGLLVIAAVMVCGIAGNVALWKRSADRHPASEQSGTTFIPSLVQQTPQPVRELPPLPVLPPPEIAPLPDRCRVEITVQEPGATLALDGNLAGGNQIKLDVPKEDKLHLVEASAPGFIPFTRSVNFTQDVYLTISLEKERPAPPPVTKEKPTRTATRRIATSRVKPDLKRADDGGMSSRPTGAKRSTSKIDEDDPYAP